MGEFLKLASTPSKKMRSSSFLRLSTLLSYEWDPLSSLFSLSLTILIEGVLRSQNLLYNSCCEGPITLLDFVSHFGTPGGNFGFCMQYGVASSERVSLAPLGCI